MKNEKQEFEIDQYTKESVNAEWEESPNSVDLRSCKKGDKLLCKDGRELTYVQPMPNGAYFDHEVSYNTKDLGNGFRTHSGKMLRNKDTDSNIIQIIRK